MAPPVRRLPAGFELAVGGNRGHRVTRHKAQRPSRTGRVINFLISKTPYIVMKE